MEPPTRSFLGDRVYTEDEIRKICPNVSYQTGNDDDDKDCEYLIAQAEVEYWFIREGEGWTVDHTWATYTMAEKAI